MTTPSGLLLWGQAGTYDAVDDRFVITALANRNQGLVAATQISPGSGLNLTVAPGWLGVANCGDATVAVVGSRTTLTVPVPAGPATGTATYYVWCDVNPDAATWQLSVITPADAVGRPGIQLATVVVPANANLASQMTITPNPPTFGNFEGVTLNTSQTGGKAYLYATKNGMLWVQSLLQGAGGAAVLSLDDGRHYGAGAVGQVNISPVWKVPAGDIIPYTHYHLHCSGEGYSPQPAQNMWFDINGLGGYARVTLNHSGWAARTPYSFALDADVQVDAGAVNCAITIRAIISPKAQPVVGVSGIAHLANVAIPSPATGGAFVFRTGAGNFGGTAETWNNTFLRHGGADPSGQIIAG